MFLLVSVIKFALCAQLFFSCMLEVLFVKTVSRNCWNLRWYTPQERIHFSFCQVLVSTSSPGLPQVFSEVLIIRRRTTNPMMLVNITFTLVHGYPFGVPTKGLVSLGFPPLCFYLALGSNLHALSHGRLSVAQCHISFATEIYLTYNIMISYFF